MALAGELDLVLGRRREGLDLVAEALGLPAEEVEGDAGGEQALALLPEGGGRGAMVAVLWTPRCHHPPRGRQKIP